MVEAARKVLTQRKAIFTMVLPSEELRSAFAGVINQPGIHIDTQIGRLHEALSTADLAIASSGTVTLECAWFGVATVVLYQLSWPEYQIGRRIVKVPFIAMPNLLAGEAVFPEFIQHDATPDNLAGAALNLLTDDALRARTRSNINRAVATLGEPGACQRAARSVLSLLER